MWVICPSTCGLIVVELRDFRVATYSVTSLTGTGWTVAIFTAMAGGCCPACALEAPSRPQPTARAAAIAATTISFKGLIARGELPSLPPDGEKEGPHILRSPPV